MCNVGSPDCINTGFYPTKYLYVDDGKYLVELQEQLNAVTVNLRDVESTIGGLQAPQGMLSLGNTSFLSQETTLERQNLYPLLVNSYKWIEKVSNWRTAIAMERHILTPLPIPQPGQCPQPHGVDAAERQPAEA